MLYSTLAKKEDISLISTQRFIVVSKKSTKSMKVATVMVMGNRGKNHSSRAAPKKATEIISYRV